MNGKTKAVGATVTAIVLIAFWLLAGTISEGLQINIAAAGDSSNKALDLLVSTSEDLTEYCLAIMGYSCAVLLTQKAISKKLGFSILATFLVSMLGAYVGLALKISMAEVIAQGAQLTGAEQPLWRGLRMQWWSLLAAITCATAVLLLVVDHNLSTKEPSP